MKKFIIILATIAFMTTISSCEPSTQQAKKYKDGTTIYARRFVYDGHTYIEFCRLAPSYDNYTGFVHDPDCQCHKTK